MTLSSKRLLQIFAVLSAWALIVIARLVQVQLIRHDDYVIRAQRQQESTLELSPVRGAILDARGRVLAESVAAESIYADPQAIRNRSAVAAKLAPILRMSSRDIESRLRSEAGFVWIARLVQVQLIRHDDYVIRAQRQQEKPPHVRQRRRTAASPPCVARRR